MNRQVTHLVLNFTAMVALLACGRSVSTSDSETSDFKLTHLRCLININNSLGQSTVRMDGFKIYGQEVSELIDTHKERNEFESVFKRLKDRCKVKSTELKFNASACEELKSSNVGKLKKDSKVAGSSVVVNFDYKDNGKKYTANYSCYMTSAPVEP